MLASPLFPSSSFSEDRETTQYRPAKDIDAFNKLLPPPIEFVEGSSSGKLVIGEGKFQPINVTTKPTSSKAQSSDSITSPSAPPSSPQTPKKHSSHPKPLYDGHIDVSWPPKADKGCGLNNIGNTCFLNSALQCLLHTPPLIRILGSHSKGEQCRVKKNCFCMACSLRTLMFECFKKEKSTTPYTITTNLSHIAKHLRRGRQEDSHEFLRYAVDALQKSCLAGYPPKLDHKLAETTWVHKIFGGRLRSRVTCLSCGCNSDTFDSILDLSVDISGTHSLRDALRRFVAIDHLKGADKYKCEKCNKPVSADKQFTVHDAPVVLSIHLKRFSPMGRKIGQLIRYDERLSLRDVMSEGQFGPTYSLYGVISHAGGGPNSGHYYAHVKAGSGQWYEMNDESVTRHSGAPTNLKNAYILFYIRDKGQTLQAALAPPPVITPPVPKGGIAANMKKRKVAGSDDEDDRKLSTAKPHFIGPRLPSPPPNPSPSTPSPKKLKPDATDPQAELLKKKIASVTKPPAPTSSALLSLSQYDDSSDDLGERVEMDTAGTDKVETISDHEPPSTPLTSTANLPSNSTPSPNASAVAPTTPTSSSSRPFVAPVPTSSFYGSSTKSVSGNDDGGSPGKKRKSPELDVDSEWARTPMVPPQVKRKYSAQKLYTGNPYSRLNRNNNLTAQRDNFGQLGQKKSKPRPL